MAEPWELVLHYTFAGTPGVIFDHSATRRSHGQPVNLTAADFFNDGVTPGSGSIQFRSKTAMIRVPPSASWNPLGGVRIEMICETDIIRTGGALVTADSFDFQTGGSFFSGAFSQAIGTSSQITEGGSEPRPLPADRWLSVAVQYDPAGAQVELNGDVVNRWHGWNGLLAGTSGLIIGNDRTGTNGLVGTIDDIKIWRLNPHLIGNTFVDRPVDTEVGRCWAEWSRKLEEVLKADPVCSKRVFDLLQRAMYAVMNILDTTPSIEPGFSELALRYQELWSQGRLTEIQGILNDMIVLLRNAGFNPAAIADLQALRNDSCFNYLVEQLPINCDVEFTDMFNVSETF